MFWKSMMPDPAIEAAYVAAHAAKIAAYVGAGGAILAAILSGLSTWQAARTQRKAAELAQRVDKLILPSLAPPMIEAFRDLWTVTGKYPLSQIGEFASLEGRTELVRAMTSWYYDNGNGMFLNNDTRDAFFYARCRVLREKEAKNNNFDLQYKKYDPCRRENEPDKELDCNMRKALGKLRTALKNQVAVYGVWKDRGREGRKSYTGLTKY